MYDDLSDPLKKMEVGEHYRSVLLRTESGRKMFTHMLSEMGLFETTEGKSERELGRFDYAMRVLEIMGVPSYPNLNQLVVAMKKWPSSYPKVKRGEFGEALDVVSKDGKNMVVDESGGQE